MIFLYSAIEASEVYIFNFSLFKEFSKYLRYRYTQIHRIQIHKLSKKDELNKLTCFLQVSFQLVIISDGFNTFAVFNYEDIFLKNFRQNFCPVSVSFKLSYLKFYFIVWHQPLSINKIITLESLRKNHLICTHTLMGQITKN